MDLVISILLDVLSNAKQVQYQYRVQIGLIAEVLIIIPCCSMAGTSTVPGAGVLLHELACVSHCPVCDPCWCRGQQAGRWL